MVVNDILGGIRSDGLNQLSYEQTFGGHEEILRKILAVYKSPIHKIYSDSESFKRFPLKTEEELETLENDLKDVNYAQKLYDALLRLDAANEKQLTRILLKKIWTNSLAMSYSWLGQKCNKKLKDLNIIQVICTVVKNKYAHATETLLRTIISDWFRQARGRLEYERQKQVKTPSEAN